VKTQYYTASSLDGFIADPQHSLDWLFQFGDVEATSYPAFMREVGAIAMGSTTYEWILKHHFGPDADRPQPWPYQQPTWVFTSRTLPELPGADIRFVRGDVRPVHEQMAAATGDRNVWVVAAASGDHDASAATRLGHALRQRVRGAPLRGAASATEPLISGLRWPTS